ncbi:unnamed protein product [Lactuca saligna]|uniref:Uncharacterized protein n=1 Tax=Lactuca saligna TaxID=75948 RepID=A0AA35V3M7_LACSI|nr:unnamed protein product [Lactuca saligna]
MTLETVNFKRRVEIFTKAVTIKEEEEEYKASAVDTVIVFETSQTFDDQANVVDVRVEEVKVEEVNFVVEDKIAEVIIEETNFMIIDDNTEAVDEFIEEVEEGDNSKVETLETVEEIMEENNFVDANKFFEEVILVEPRKKFQESMTSTTVYPIDDKQVQKHSTILKSEIKVEHIKCEDVIVVQEDAKVMEVSHHEDPNVDLPMVCQDVTPTDRPPEETKGDVCVNPCVTVVILSSFTISFDKKFCVIGDGEVLLMIQRLQGQLLLDDDKMLYPIEDNMGEVSQRNILGGCDQTRKVGSCGESKLFYWLQTTDVVIGSSFVIEEHKETWGEVGDERTEKDGVYSVTNHLPKSKKGVNQHEESSPKYSHGKGFIMFGFLFLWCTLSWEASMLGRAIHQSTNRKHDSFFQRTDVNLLNFYKVNFQGPYLFHEKLQKWFLFHKWRVW